MTNARHNSRHLVGSTSFDLPVGYHPARAEWLRHAATWRLRSTNTGDGRYAFLTGPAKALRRQWEYETTGPGQVTGTFRRWDSPGEWRYVTGAYAAVLRTFHRWGLITDNGAITPLGRLVLVSWDAEEGNADLSGCPFYRDRAHGVCTSGCWQEPACVVDEPATRWPRAAAQPTYG